MEIKKYQNPNPNGKPLVDCPGCKQRKEHHAKGYCYNCYKKLAWKRKLVRCKSCGRMRYHKAFGLCGGCHTRIHHYEKIKQYNTQKNYNISLEKLKTVTKACAICGFDKTIELHHLDGDKKNTSEENLIGLCPNCHKMIHSYAYYEEIKNTLKKKGYNVENIHPTSYVNKRRK